MVLRRGAVQVVHGGRIVARAPRAAQGHDVARAILRPKAPRAQSADVIVLVGPSCGSHVHGVGDGHGHLGEGSRRIALAGKAGAARSEHPVHVAGPTVSGPERQQPVGLHLGELDPRSPCRVATADARTGALERETRAQVPRADVLLFAQTAPLDRPLVVRIHRQRIGQVVPSGLDLVPDGLGVHEGIARQRAVEPVGADASVVAEALGEPALDSCREVVLLRAPPPVPVAMADEAVPDREDVISRRLERRVGLARRFVDCIEQARAWGNGEDIDRRGVAERRASVRDVCVHVEPGALSERVVEAQDCVPLVVALGVPPEVAVGEPAALVARVDPRRVAERSGVALRPVALAERHRSQLALARVEHVDRVAAYAHVLRLGEAPARCPLRAAVLAGAAGDLLAVEDVDADGQVSAFAEPATPYDAALAGVAAVAGRHPGDGAHVEAVQILPQHEVECASYRGVPGEGAQALGSQHLDALDRREREGVQIMRGRCVGPPVHQDEQVAPSGKEVADDPCVEHLSERLGAGALDEAAVVLGDDLRGWRQRAGMDLARRQHGGRGERREDSSHRRLPITSWMARRVRTCVH